MSLKCIQKDPLSCVPSICLYCAFSLPAALLLVVFIPVRSAWRFSKFAISTSTGKRIGQTADRRTMIEYNLVVPYIVHKTARNPEQMSVLDTYRLTPHNTQTISLSFSDCLLFFRKASKNKHCLSPFLPHTSLLNTAFSLSFPLFHCLPFCTCMQNVSPLSGLSSPSLFVLSLMCSSPLVSVFSLAVSPSLHSFLALSALPPLSSVWLVQKAKSITISYLRSFVVCVPTTFMLQPSHFLTSNTTLVSVSVSALRSPIPPLTIDSQQTFHSAADFEQIDGVLSLSLLLSPCCFPFSPLIWLVEHALNSQHQLNAFSSLLSSSRIIFSLLHHSLSLPRVFSTPLPFFLPYILFPLSSSAHSLCQHSFHCSHSVHNRLCWARK